MATPHIGPLPNGTKPCKVCREPINIEASKCVHCGSEQGWRARLGMSSTVLSLMIALISVATVAVSTIFTMMTPNNSDLRFAYQGATKDRLSLLVSNAGIRPGSVRSGALQHGSVVLVLHVQGLPKNEPRIVETGKSELLTMYSESTDESTGEIKDCVIRLRSIDFLGKEHDQPFKLECTAVMSFIWARRGRPPGT